MAARIEETGVVHTPLRNRDTWLLTTPAFLNSIVLRNCMFIISALVLLDKVLPGVILSSCPISDSWMKTPWGLWKGR